MDDATTKPSGAGISVLFASAEDGSKRETPDAPDFFVDLNLDQIIDAITVSKAEYDLKPFFYASPQNGGTIEYRQEVMRDLENRSLFQSIESFAGQMRLMREHLAQADKLYYRYQKERWFLDAVQVYCAAVDKLVHDLSLADLGSRGFMTFAKYLADYATSAVFTSLVAETHKLIADLGKVKYCLLIKNSAIQVRPYEGETDYSAVVEATFEKFKQGAVKDYLVEYRSWPEMNHVEGQILEFVAQLYADVFARLDDYCARNRSYLAEAISTFDREVQFYVAYLDYMAAFKRVGLKFCYPRVSDECKEVHNYEGYDLALAYKLIGEHGTTVVRNDFELRDDERIIVVSGPNQGGKTTFARAFGQLHYLASIGLPVAGREARLFLFDRLFTHFEREEDVTNLQGKLQDDLVRMHNILEQATSNSIVVINEIFTSTTLQDAVFLGNGILERIMALDLLCVCVTFIDELGSLSEKTVSMVSTVVPDNPTQRTFRILRRPADGLSYAVSIAEKYRLTYKCLKERLAA